MQEPIQPEKRQSTFGADELAQVLRPYKWQAIRYVNPNSVFEEQTIVLIGVVPSQNAITYATRMNKGISIFRETLEAGSSLEDLSGETIIDVVREPVRTRKSEIPLERIENQLHTQKKGDLADYLNSILPQD